MQHRRTSKDVSYPFVFLLVLGVLLFVVSIAIAIITTLYFSLVENEQECVETYQMNRTTRSLTVQKGRFVELGQCNSPQYEIPNMPEKSENVVGIYIDTLEYLMVCGGSINEDDHPSPDHPKLCFVHKLCSCEWKEFYKLNTNRLKSFIKTKENKIIILRGQSSHPVHDCYQSQEVLDLTDLSKGWKEEPSEGVCITGQSIIEVPCIEHCNLNCNMHSRFTPSFNLSLNSLL